MDELLSGAEGQFRTQGNGTPGALEPRGTVSVSEALEGDLDAYLDRELLEACEDDAAVEDPAPVTDVSASMRALLALAEEETEWLERLPSSTSHTLDVLPEPTVEIPEWMRTSPGAKKVTSLGALLPPRAENVLARAPDAPMWGDAPPHAHLESARWRAASATETGRVLGLRPGELMGAAAVGALAAGLMLAAGLYVRGDFTGTQVRVDDAMRRTANGAVLGASGDAQAGLSSAGAGVAMSTAAPSGHTIGASTSTQAAVSGSSPDAVLAASSHVSGAAWSVAVSSTQPGMGSALLQDAAKGLRASVPASEPVRSPGTPVAESLAVVSPAPIKRKALAKPDAAAALPPAPVELDFGDTGAEGAASQDAIATSPGDVVAEAVEEDTSEKGPYADLDETFARELGFTEDADAEVSKAEEPARTVYVPPAVDVKEHLTPEDVKQVVLTNQPAITACLRSHAQGTPMEAGGRFMVQWSVLPSGETLNVSMDTAALRATPLSRCIEDVVRRWKFPVHQVRMQEPIRFPFIF
ncbi:AgmX/PglI C-terminal domain-containing protein [Myxococcus sp. MxC21-1]|uniref:AgmX/PglI C-terminal domain-containing protein n=1 Tax=Myxococcus sp. MxC21-1 TaxID=3041439 RepID=UPI00292F8A41|nr:AgmX/PglI C-terminal domain-containing protein [Myxococcus sp. MxC21-1]WNZ62769.1 AgmX/PglI C-terminal domain-containing protein [Myxococcus sp. MxC21-1]